ncbi:MAG TPA: tRNA glutamyl-Q(34) synthetase GluQRS [Polyangia bacterium]|jgi:glutamyl-tRNA synthetase|nr:tRNA glutamyl-Q(34) synthetase GluQRS [Polyangia bacterium]
MAARRGRYAPSPTGAIHLGNARTALLAWLDARAAGAAFVMRVEDLDRARVVAGAEARLFDDLRWLGLDWDEGPEQGGAFAPYRQSERVARYDEAVARLLAAGRAFPCACSRADVARAASAPHAGDEEGPRYAGTCRGVPVAEIEARAAAQGRAPAIRFDGRSERLSFVDLVHGEVAAGPEGVDDFVLRRADGTAAYQLAVVVDDAAMEITRVVRGDDLLASTPRQLALYAALGAAPPTFAHVPLVLAPGGERLAKRTRPTSLADLRARGVAPEAVVGALAASAGLCAPGTRLRAAALVDEFSLARVARAPAVVDVDLDALTI